MIEVGNPASRAMIKTGTYTGDGNDDRDIDIGVNLILKKNVEVIVSPCNTIHLQHRPEQGQGDLTKMIDGGGEQANRIQAITVTGFQIGSDAEVNNNAVVYRYIVFWQEA